MCGIAGMVGTADAVLLRRMLERLRHRGPDDTGVFVDDGIAIGQTRLSIIDVEGGRQPILDEEGQGCVVANGEIYNHRMLAKEFSRHPFRTRSDTEAALHAYEEIGPEVAVRLDGMFALAIWDGDTVYLARDPMGIKPLYYAIEGGALYFASEIKALLPASRRIREFPNGHWYRADRGFRPYAEWPTEVHHGMPPEEAIARVKELLPWAVEKRLMSDVPLGSFCSGGLDSTIVTALAASFLGSFHTFSTGMAGSADLGQAEQAAEHLGTVHHIREFSEDEFLNILPTVAWHLESYDAALFRSAVPTYFVSELAKRFVKVVLTGEGADELFAGYAYLKDVRPESALHEELVRITRALHNTNLQRTDRMTMAHGLEGRVPFLDWAHAGFALSIPAGLKAPSVAGIEKRILREAFRDVLPLEVADRTKQKFADGTGSADLLRLEANRQIPDSEFERERTKLGIPLRTKEELYCYRLFQERFELPEDVVRDLVGTTAVY